jgi:7-cyano-7-deazaguanine synthase
MKKAICIVSGGIDSLSAAALIKSQGYEISAITFAYGQKASREIEQAKKILKHIGVKEHKVVDISFMNDIYGESNSLTSGNVKVSNTFDYSLVVPLRNMIFLSIASAWAFSSGAEKVVYGAHATDKPYPDCRPEFAKHLAEVVNEGEIDSIKAGTRSPVGVWSPAMDKLTKSELINIGYPLIGEVIFESWSCYLDGTKQCGKCESCNNRKKAFADCKIQDKTMYDESELS